MKILGCAVGDFKRSPGALIFVRKLKSPHMDTEIQCACTGIVISGMSMRSKALHQRDSYYIQIITEACADLPNYASCGLMRFKVSMFRDTMYR